MKIKGADYSKRVGVSVEEIIRLLYLQSIRPVPCVKEVEDIFRVLIAEGIVLELHQHA